jgi:hypothetical protein
MCGLSRLPAKLRGKRPVHPSTFRWTCPSRLLQGVPYAAAQQRRAPALFLTTATARRDRSRRAAIAWSTPSTPCDHAAGTQRLETKIADEAASMAARTSPERCATWLGGCSWLVLAEPPEARARAIASEPFSCDKARLESSRAGDLLT